MSYIDAFNDRNGSVIKVVERNSVGIRQIKEYPISYTFYYGDPKGKHRSIYGDPLTRFTTRKKSEFEKEKRIHSNKKIFESDIKPEFRCLSDNYMGQDSPKLHTCFFDIEVDWDAKRGFAPPSDPFNKITSITFYNDWSDQLITMAIPPKTLSYHEAEEIASTFENTFVFEKEADMLEAMFSVFEDADILTGWNSEGFDVPYLVNRVTRVLSKDDTRKFCLFNQFPKPRKYNNFGKEETTYDLIGRVHMDYLQLYKKFNYENRQSYKLDNIGELEVGERKTEYEGTLDQLYNNDFHKFIEYNRQDVMLLYKIHAKLKYLDLASQMAHENTVTLPTVMGSVAIIEHAIYNESHERGLIVPDRQKIFEYEVDEDEEDIEDKAAGAYVAHPKKGIHKYVGAVDLSSLYPSTIRSLNIAPETMIGQVRLDRTDEYIANEMKKNGGKFAQAWEGIFCTFEYQSIMNREIGTLLTIDFNDGRVEQYSAAEIYDMIFDSNRPWDISANATIFTYEKEGVIPGLLTRWYSERKVLQKKAKSISDLEKGIDIPEDMMNELSELMGEKI